MKVWTTLLILEVFWALAFGEISEGVQNCQLAFANWSYLCCGWDIHLLNKGWVYYEAIHSVLLYNCETWPLKTTYIRKLLIFDHRCLQTIAHKFYDHRVSDSGVRCRVLSGDNKLIDKIVNLYRLRWLGHVLHMPVHQLPWLAMIAVVGAGEKRARDGQIKTYLSSTWSTD